MVLLDPGSLAFDFPEKYGYRLLFKDLADYSGWSDRSSWNDHISYETKFLTRNDIMNLTIEYYRYQRSLLEKFDSMEIASNSKHTIESSSTKKWVTRIMSPLKDRLSKKV